MVSALLRQVAVVMTSASVSEGWSSASFGEDWSASADAASA